MLSGIAYCQNRINSIDTSDNSNNDNDNNNDNATKILNTSLIFSSFSLIFHYYSSEFDMLLNPQIPGTGQPLSHRL